VIHAVDPAGRPHCGQLVAIQRRMPVTQALYRDLCPNCIQAVTALCRRLAR
jgi:hypothetical protein